MSLKKYIVGGWVRDKLLTELGHPMQSNDKDWVVTGATPEEMLKLKFVPVGNDFPVFLHPKTHEEYALARTERKSGHGYKGFTFFTDSSVTLEQDLLRRDLTVNAMAMDQRGNIRDFYGGRADLAAGILRCVGAPERRFREDALRMLRACRFAAQLGFAIEPETWAALLRCAPLCKQLSRERITEEVTKTIRSPSPQWAAAMIRCGLLTSCCLTGSNDLSQLSVLPPTAEARWAGFGLLVPELDFSAFRLPAKLVKLCRMARAHWPAPEERLGWKRLLAAEGEEAARLLATLAQTDAVDEIIASGDCVSLKTLAVSGRDFPLLRGPALGQMLHALLGHVLQCPADNNRETLLELAKNIETAS